MRWIIPLSSGVVGLLIGIGVGLTLAPHTVVVREAPSMSLVRYVASSEAQVVGLTEAEWNALWVPWRLRHWWPHGLDWPTP
jgi:hypothetical protein